MTLKVALDLKWTMKLKNEDKWSYWQDLRVINYYYYYYYHQTWWHSGHVVSGVRLIGYFKLVVGVNVRVNGYPSRPVSPLTDWQPVQRVPRLFSTIAAWIGSTFTELDKWLGLLLLPNGV